MNYVLSFDERALKEFQSLDSSIREQLKKKLKNILVNPMIEAKKLRSFKNCYKIKLQSSGYRLVYQVDEKTKEVCVVAVAKREKEAAYTNAQRRL
ncbi:type II toxin-antitoxin system mRNA interferase toxin, RelE/StbE family [Aeromonas salmonicida]|uniref:type II toxin-antitoxin system RelE family toxin n=1 Tax=Aeromonas salmonicida TaxID=645 RepID=UPI000F78891E|nr:type II toxin-antitoxin system RelE/ParE family toxin [Aeromonas salmonicida]RSM28390.1 type II toxin-antitoxin system mRNA interferase toxin, RelE/StbE family [Aeromonas salmonicida]